MRTTKGNNILVLPADFSYFRDIRSKNGKGVSIYTLARLRKYGQKEYDWRNNNVILKENLNTADIRGSIEQHKFKRMLDKIELSGLIETQSDKQKILYQNFDPIEGFIQLDIDTVLQIEDDFDLLIYAGIKYYCGYYGGIFTDTIPRFTQKLGFAPSSTKEKVRVSIKRLEEMELIYVKRYQILNIRKGKYDIQDFSMSPFNLSDRIQNLQNFQKSQNL